jgi:membrane protease YdiL (CAAX protease family)
MPPSLALPFGKVLAAVAAGYAGVAAFAFLATISTGRVVGFDAREAAFFLATGIATLVLSRIAGDRSWREELAVSWPQERRVPLAFLAALLVVLFIEAALAVSGIFGSLDELKAMSPSERSLLGLANAVLLAPFVEELLFRGLLFTALRKRLSAFPTLAATTLAFGLLHIENGLLHVVSVLPAGAFLGYAREKSGGAGLPILLHAFMNAAVVVAGLLL